MSPSFPLLSLLLSLLLLRQLPDRLVTFFRVSVSLYFDP
jgi:hypothetical protein